MHIPAATYRIQFHKDFTFKHLHAIIDYLHDIGISSIYASPITMASPGSTHGYDVTDPHRINPEIGTLDELKSIASKLKEKGMRWIQDIVPNHMAFDLQNWRLKDVLEKGPASLYYNYFDIDWDHPDKLLNGKLMVPVLEDDFETCLELDKILLGYDSGSGFTINYGNNKYPLSKLSKKQVRAASAASSVETFISHVNRDKKRLRQLLNDQHYVLTWYGLTSAKINYRRFFTVNSLICLSMEQEDVFDEYHLFLAELYHDDLIQGLRIDHIDGLKNPGEYLQRLRNLFGPDCYIIIEKILEAKENLPRHWPIQGTSGYEFLAYTSQVLTGRSGATRLVDQYREISKQSYPEIVFEKKKLILEKHMAGELDNLVHYFFSLQPGDVAINRDCMRKAIALFMICLPVYRIYPENFPLSAEERELLMQAFILARQRDPALQPELQLLEKLFQLPSPFTMRLMQFTGPLTAKGVEDTTFYVYNAFISHNEVGDSPSVTGISVGTFHNKMLERRQHNNLCLNATGTHDTKRGEEARLRINLLSEFQPEWQQLINEWNRINSSFTGRVDCEAAPSPNDAYFLYQSLLGGFPIDGHISDEYRERVRNYYRKALRESKVNTSWDKPHEEYEKACMEYVDHLLSPDHSFAGSLAAFVDKIDRVANIFSLNQLVIKTTAPGIPDIYQGCELWDISFVDPDNRRPVDYEHRKTLLQQMEAKEREGNIPLIEWISRETKTGIAKLYTLKKILQLRKEQPLLFSEGNYLPVYPTESDDAVIAWLRHYNDQWLLVVLPLKMIFDALPRLSLALPEHAPQAWKNVFTGEELRSTELNLHDIFWRFPVAVFINGM